MGATNYVYKLDEDNGKKVLETFDNLIKEANGDVLEINFTPLNYTPTYDPVTTPTCEDDQDLTAHLKGIDLKLDEAIDLDGDKLDIDFNPDNYTPDATIPEASDVDDLSAHLKGIDTALSLLGGKVKLYYGNDSGSNTVTSGEDVLSVSGVKVNDTDRVVVFASTYGAFQGTHTHSVSLRRNSTTLKTVQILQGVTTGDFPKCPVSILYVDVPGAAATYAYRLHGDTSGTFTLTGMFLGCLVVGV